MNNELKKKKSETEKKRTGKSCSSFLIECELISRANFFELKIIWTIVVVLHCRYFNENLILANCVYCACGVVVVRFWYFPSGHYIYVIGQFQNIITYRSRHMMK